MSSRFISISVRGGNKAPLAGLTLPATSPLTTLKCQQTRKMSREVSSQSDISKMKVEPDGSFKRAPSSFRNFVQKDGQFPPEKGKSAKPVSLFGPSNSPTVDRYHLYVSYACRESSPEQTLRDTRVWADPRPLCSLGNEDADYSKTQGS